MPESFDELIEHQRRRWEIDRGAGMPQPRGICVAISRLPASGGAEIAERVASWLDYGFFGAEILDRIARDPGASKRLEEGLDAERLEVIDRRVGDVFAQSAAQESEYLRSVARTMATLGERGMAVLLGRGGTKILLPRRALRVLVVGPAEERARRLAEAEGLSFEAAERDLERQDAERVRFLKEHFAVTLDDPLRYDLVINTGHLGIDAAAALVVDALRKRFPA